MKKKQPNRASQLLTVADILIMVFFATGVLVIIALFFYVLSHEAL